MIDLSYKPNLIIVLSTFLAAAVGWVLTGSFLAGLYISIGVFLTWALAREIDPKHDYSALLAAAFSLVLLFYYDSIQLLVIAWLLLLLRMVNRLCGKELTVFDIFSALGLTIYLSFNDENSIYLMLFLLAILFVSRGREKSRTLFIVIGISLVLFLIESFFLDYLSFEGTNELNPLTLFTLATLVLSVVLFWFLSKEDATDDRGNKVSKSKLLAGQLLYTAAIFLLYFFSDISLNNLIIYMSAILGVAIHFIGLKALTRGRST